MTLTFLSVGVPSLVCGAKSQGIPDALKRSQALLQKNDTFLSEERPLELGITSYQLPLETETTLLVIFAYG